MAPMFNFKSLFAPATGKNKADGELLFKGLLCVVIGLIVLVAPIYMGASTLQAAMAKSSLVGWFAVVLGCAFIVLYRVRRARRR